MPSKVVKAICKYIVKPFGYILGNQSFVIGVRPNDLKVALINHIFNANSN